MQAKTLFLRNLDVGASNYEIINLMTQYVARNAIRKVSKVRMAAFIDFNTREAAEYCLRSLQGEVFKGRRLDIEWAKPSAQ